MLPLLVHSSPGTTFDRQAGFRIRSTFDTPLNDDKGWAGDLGKNVTIFADEPFRIRFEVERTPGKAGAWRFRLQVRRNGKSWENLEARDFPKPDMKIGKTPRVSLVACAAYRNGAATTNLLDGSSKPFRPGSGVGLDNRTDPWTGDGGHGEFEWAVVVRRFADDVVTNEPGDTFEFRMITDDSTPLDATNQPVLPLAVRPGHVGGTFVETPGRIGPFQAGNGDLYFIIEPAETSDIFMMIKSSDQGRTWKEVDGANRPPTRDLESVDGRLVGDTLHIIHQIAKTVRYHSFRTSDHPTHPDTWAVRGEKAAKAKQIAQAATLAVRSDGSMVAFYVGRTKIHYSVRDLSGKWREIGVIDSALSPQCVLGGNDDVHLAYYSPDGSVWYRRLDRKGALSKPQRLASGLARSKSMWGSVLPLLYHSKTDTVFIVYRQKDGALRERRIVGGGDPTPAVKATDRAVIQNAVDSQQPAADVVLDGETLHILFVEQSSRSLYVTRYDGGWQRSKLLVDGIRGSWIRGSVYARPDGKRVLGYVYDAGSEGGAGMNRFGELTLSQR